MYIHCGRITRLDGLLNKDGWGGEEIKEGRHQGHSQDSWLN